MKKSSVGLLVACLIIISGMIIERIHKKRFNANTNGNHNVNNRGFLLTPMGILEYIASVLLPPSPKMVMNSSDVEWTYLFRNNYKEILNEYLTFQEKMNNCERKMTFKSLYPKEVVYWIPEKSKWYMPTLFCYDNHKTNISIHFPITMNTINKVNKDSWLPKIHLASFSVLPANTSISFHYGPSPGVMRYQLGLQIPKHSPKDLYLEVWNNHGWNRANFDSNKTEKRRLYWNNGSDFIFDDTCRHGVRNELTNGSLERIILFLDIERQDFNILQKIFFQILVKLASFVLPFCTGIDNTQIQALQNCL